MRDVERGRGIVDGAADQRLHRGVAAAGIDQLDVEAVVLEVAVRARDLVGHDAEKLAAEGELELLQRRGLRAGRAGGGKRAGDDADAFQDRAAGNVRRRQIGAGQAGPYRRGMIFVAAAHEVLQWREARIRAAFRQARLTGLIPSIAAKYRNVTLL